MNLDFLHRSYKSALIALGLVLLFVLMYLGPRFALGFGLAALLGIANVRFLEECVVNLLRPGGARGGKVILAVSVKLLVVYGGGALLLFKKLSSPAAFASGFSFIFVIIVLKAAGRLYVERTARPALERKDSR